MPPVQRPHDPEPTQGPVSQAQSHSLVLLGKAGAEEAKFSNVSLERASHTAGRPLSPLSKGGVEGGASGQHRLLPAQKPRLTSS